VNETAANGHDGGGFWSLTAHADVVAVHKDWRTFSSEVGGTELEELEHDPEALLAARRTMLETDPPRHTKLRQLVNPTFSRLAVQTVRRTRRRHLMNEVLRRRDRDVRHGRHGSVDGDVRASPVSCRSG
jgi:cytochrome P450